MFPLQSAVIGLSLSGIKYFWDIYPVGGFQLPPVKSCGAPPNVPGIISPSNTTLASSRVSLGSNAWTKSSVGHLKPYPQPISLSPNHMLNQDPSCSPQCPSKSSTILIDQITSLPHC